MFRAGNFFSKRTLPLLLSLCLVSCTFATPAMSTLPPKPSAQPVGEQAGIAPTEPIAIITYIEGEVFVTAPVAQHRSPGLMAPAPQAATPITAPTKAPPPAPTNAPPTVAPPTIAPATIAPATAVPPTVAPPPAQAPAEQAATPFQKVAAGATIRTAPTSSATIVCLNGQAYQVTGGQRVAITSTLCQSAQPLPPNSVAAVAPNNGKLVENSDGSEVIEGETRERESDYGQLPIILSPRNTTLLTMTPMLRWVDVTGALEYELSLSGLSSFTAIVVDTSSLICHEDGRTTPNRICTYPWPTEWQLEAGQRYFLTVSARTGIAAPLRESETSALRTLPDAEATELQAIITDITALDLDGVTRNLLLAGHYRAYAVLDQAIDAYAEAYAIQPAPEVAVALGDVYLAIELQRFAALAYQAALDQVTAGGKDKPDVRAAAEFGIGLVYYSRGNYSEAESHLSEAVTLYAAIGAEKEQGNAQAALEAAQARNPD